MGITMKDNGLQCSIFDGENPLKITKPLRLIELFAGIGAQAKALENLCVNFEHYRICEFDKYAVASYNAVHGTNFKTSDITQIHAEDLGIVETDKYEYIMTYSFPCTDLSTAGKQKGMSRDSGTRSGLLWEVERLLKETKELPQILLMENVPDVLSEKNRKDFFFWCEFLESLEYTSKYAILNAKDFGVPQNRERCFMLSWLGKDYYYDFPLKKPLVVRLKDILDTSVDEKYYLSKKNIDCVLKWKSYKNPFDGICGDNSISPTITTRVVDSASMILYSNKLSERSIIKDKEELKHLSIRRLTEKECWRLMGFDDESFERAEKVVSNSQLYKQSGNSIVVNVLMAIFKNLF